MKSANFRLVRSIYFDRDRALADLELASDGDSVRMPASQSADTDTARAAAQRLAQERG